MADGHGCGEQALIELAGGILVHVGKHMGVGVEGDAHIGMAQTMLDYLCADSCGNQCGCITVAKIMQTNFRKLMDCLYVAYTDNQGRDPKEIDQCFIDLEYYLEKLSLEENNAIFKMVCRLCCLHEEKAFKDGLRIGAYLMLELQRE